MKVVKFIFILLFAVNIISAQNTGVSDGKPVTWYNSLVKIHPSNFVPNSTGWITEPPIHPITHDQIYASHPNVVNGDYVGQVHVNATDSIFNSHISYTWSIVSGNSTGAFSVSSTGMLTVADYTEVDQDYTLGVEITSNTGAKDTAECFVDYRTGTEGSVLIYVDASHSGTDAGTYANPYQDLTQVDGNDYSNGATILVKRGTSYTLTQDGISPRLKDGARTVWGAYGTGDKPVIHHWPSDTDGYIFRTGSNTWSTDSDSITIMDFKLSGSKHSTTDALGTLYTGNYGQGIWIYRCDADSISRENGIWYFRGKDTIVTSGRVYDCVIEDQFVPAGESARGVKSEAIGNMDITNFVHFNAVGSSIMTGIHNGAWGRIRYHYAVAKSTSVSRSGVQARAEQTNIEWSYYNGFYRAIGLSATEDANAYQDTIRNIYIENATNGIEFYWYSGAAYPWFDDNLIENVYIKEPSQYGLYIQTHNTTSVYIRDNTFNNILVDGAGINGMRVVAGEVSTSHSLKVNNSLFINSTSDDIVVTGSLTGDSLKNTIYETESGLNYFNTETNYDFDTGDPFVDYDNGDFRSADGASTIDAGTSASGVDEDILSNTIFGASDVDIGPFNFGGTKFNWTIR